MLALDATTDMAG